MKRTKVQYARFLRVLDLIRQGQKSTDNLSDLSSVSGRHTLATYQSIARKLECSTKTVSRDVAFLTDQLGCPLEFDILRQGWKLTEPNYRLTAGCVGESSLDAILAGGAILDRLGFGGLATALTRLVDQVCDIPPKIVERIRSGLKASIRVEGHTTVCFSSDAVRVVVKAMLEHRRVFLTLKLACADEKDSVRFDPYELALDGKTWVLRGVVHRQGKDTSFESVQLQSVLTASLMPSTFSIPAETSSGPCAMPREQTEIVPCAAQSVAA